MQNYKKINIMIAFELLNINRGLLSCMKEAGLRLDDVGYVDMYSDFVRMKAEGDKVSYIVAVLADRYCVSERTVYQYVKRLGADCSLPTVARGG